MEEPFDEEEIQRLVKDLDEAGTRAFHELYCFSNMVFSRTQLASTVLVCPINTLYAWNAELGCLTIHIVVDIFRHDEITISCNDDLSYENWSKVLLKGYRFRCQCEVCQTRTPRGDASVTRRKRMGEINDAMVEAETTRAEVKSPPTDKGCLAKGWRCSGFTCMRICAIHSLPMHIIVSRNGPTQNPKEVRWRTSRVGGPWQLTMLRVRGRKL